MTALLALQVLTNLAGAPPGPGVPRTPPGRGPSSPPPRSPTPPWRSTVPLPPSWPWASPRTQTCCTPAPSPRWRTWCGRRAGGPDSTAVRDLGRRAEPLDFARRRHEVASREHPAAVHQLTRVHRVEEIRDRGDARAAEEQQRQPLALRAAPLRALAQPSRD